MKKFVSVMLSSFLAFSLLTGCGGEDNTEVTTEPTSETGSEGNSDESTDAGASEETSGVGNNNAEEGETASDVSGSDVSDSDGSGMEETEQFDTSEWVSALNDLDNEFAGFMMYACDTQDSTGRTLKAEFKDNQVDFDNFMAEIEGLNKEYKAATSQDDIDKLTTKTKTEIYDKMHELFDTIGYNPDDSSETQESEQESSNEQETE